MAMYRAVTKDWQITSAFPYCRGSRISETILKKAGVPA